MPIKEELTLNKLHNLLSKSQLTISTAESCTGGIISSELTKLPNSSLYFIGAIIAYQNTIKENVLGVSSSTLSEYGAVSEQTVREMARGVAKLMNTDLAISISGIAGPGGGPQIGQLGDDVKTFNVRFDGNDFSNSGDDGIGLFKVHKVRINNNIIADNFARGIVFNNSTYITDVCLRNNIISRNNIKLNGASYYTCN